MFEMFKYEYVFKWEQEYKKGIVNPEFQFHQVYVAKDYCEALKLFWSDIPDFVVLVHGIVTCGLYKGYFTST